MLYTRHHRLITEQFSDSPVTRVKIKRNELVIRYSKDCSEERQDEIFDKMIALETTFSRKGSRTVRIKILDTDDLQSFQCEIGSTDFQSKIIKRVGVDFFM